jgi:hypothetical protein
MIIAREFAVDVKPLSVIFLNRIYLCLLNFAGNKMKTKNVITVVLPHVLQLFSLSRVCD